MCKVKPLITKSDIETDQSVVRVLANHVAAVRMHHVYETQSRWTTSQLSVSLCSKHTYTDHSWGCRPQPGTKRQGEGILRMEDARTSEEDDIESQDSNTTRPSSPELFNKDHNAGHKSLSHFNELNGLNIVSFNKCCRSHGYTKTHLHVMNIKRKICV